MVSDPPLTRAYGVESAGRPSASDSTRAESDRSAVRTMTPESALWGLGAAVADTMRGALASGSARSSPEQPPSTPAAMLTPNSHLEKIKQTLVSQGRRRAQPQPVSLCGLSTGFDSGDPRCRRKIDNTTMLAMARNSLCQFWKDSNQNLQVPAY